MNLEPGVIFAIVTGAAIVLTIGTGVAIGLGLYQADRSVRNARANTPTPYNFDPTPEARHTSAAPAMSLNPVSQFLTAGGQVEVAPSLGLGHVKLGMWIFLANEVVFFTSLIVAFLLFRSHGMITFRDTEALNVPFTALNTFLLLSSSFTLVLAFDAVNDGKLNRFRWLLAATFVLGAAFVSIQGVEWTTLFAEGIGPTTSTFGTVFFVLTGFHGLHVIIGLLWLLIILGAASRGYYSEKKNLGIEIFGLYWHFVDIVWIILFTIIYLI